MLKIALTGNIASGKSTVLNIIKSFSIKTLCLDELVQVLYEDDADFKKKLLEHFNTDKKNEISKFAFNTPEYLRLLESLIYPKLKEELNLFFEANTDKEFVVVDAPTLFESGFNVYFDKIIFVSCDEEIRLKRLMKRNGLSKSDAQKRINSQMRESDKITHSDYIIINNGDINELESQLTGIIKGLKLRE